MYFYFEKKCLFCWLRRSFSNSGKNINFFNLKLSLLAPITSNNWPLARSATYIARYYIFMFYFWHIINIISFYSRSHAFLWLRNDEKMFWCWRKKLISMICALCRHPTAIFQLCRCTQTHTSRFILTMQRSDYTAPRVVITRRRRACQQEIGKSDAALLGH